MARRWHLCATDRQSTGQERSECLAVGDGGEESPLGALVAEATGAGYRVGAGRAPFHGYYYHILTGQGPEAPGGELSYVVNGKMIGGFGLWPIRPNMEIRSDDIHRQSRWFGFSERPRTEYNRTRQAHDTLQPRSVLEESRRKRRPAVT